MTCADGGRAGRGRGSSGFSDAAAGAAGGLTAAERMMQKMGWKEGQVNLTSLSCFWQLDGMSHGAEITYLSFAVVVHPPYRIGLLSLTFLHM